MARYLYGIYGVSIFAFGMAFFCAIDALFMPWTGGVGGPASLAFISIGFLAVAAAKILNHQEHRLARLERAVSLQQPPAK
jgi:hypothetical protein